MSNIDIISMTLRNLFKRKLRAFLTILGVVVGTTAIIVMVSFGIAVNQGFEENLANMGDIRILTIRNPSAGGMGPPSANGEPIVLNEKALNNFKLIEGVYAATPVVGIDMTAVTGKLVGWIGIKGIDPFTMADFEYNLAEGEFLKGEKNGIVFGSEVPMNFSDPNDRNWWRNMDWENMVAPFDVMQDKIEMSFESGYGYNYETPFDTEPTEEEVKQKPKPYELKVNGVLAPMNWDTDSYAFMDINEVLKIKQAQLKYQQNEGIRYYGSNTFNSAEYDYVMVKCADINVVEDVKLSIEEQGFYVDSYYIDMLNEMQKTSQSLQIFLGAIGAVSLFVAAIGISNTMIMSVYERTREIGIMKVIGSSIKDIRKLFLLEAMVIGLLGGSIGVLLSYLISWFFNTVGLSIIGSFLGYGGTGSAVSVIPVWLALTALGVSSVIGLLSGYFPARRAMNLSALAAIRME